MRSAAFLSVFVQLIWLGVCSTRTFLFARLFPWISHDYFDGPYGCIFVASLICGSSIWIENPRRRGEIALSLLPRALGTVSLGSWLKGGRRSQFVERCASDRAFLFFVLLKEFTLQDCLRRFSVYLAHFRDPQARVAQGFIEMGCRLCSQRNEFFDKEVAVIPLFVFIIPATNGVYGRRMSSWQSAKYFPLHKRTTNLPRMPAIHVDRTSEGP